MANFLAKFRGLFDAKADAALPVSVTKQASSGTPYAAASSSRRTIGWNPTNLGPSGVQTGTLELMRARSHDEIRNNPWAASAVDNFESQIIGNGIWPHWNLPNQPDLKLKIERKFRRWALLNNFAALQATAAREIFEGGEVFCRRYIRPSSWNLRIPLEIQLIEGEQVPVFLNTVRGGQPNCPPDNSIRTGIEFDPSNRITAYHMYREHPGETMFFPMTGLTYMRVPASEILHVFKRQRAGMLRGTPHLSAVLNTLHELGKYTDAAVVKKQIQTMFAGFITKVDPANDILPPDTSSTDGAAVAANSALDLGVQNSKIETGTMQVLLPGENIVFPNLPQDSDIETFLSVCLHQFAVGIGATYEQITGDLRGVNLSSIRAGILDFRRKCEQFQQNIIIQQFIMPVVLRWWLPEAVMAGEISLPGYAQDPELYEDVEWSTPAWPYIDPLKDCEANQMMVRSGFKSREAVVAEVGSEAAIVDAQHVVDNKRADALGLIYDSDPRYVLGKGESATSKGEAADAADSASNKNAPKQSKPSGK